MREISCNAIISSIKEMCIQATHYLSDDMKSALYKGVEKEESPLGRQILEQLCENLTIAGEDMIPICQDTGMAVVFVEIGQEVHITGGVFQGKEGCIMRLHRNTKLVFAFGNMTVAISYLQAFPFEKVD